MRNIVQSVLTLQDCNFQITSMDILHQIGSVGELLVETVFLSLCISVRKATTPSYHSICSSPYDAYRIVTVLNIE
jgi:hypothetical protein